MVFAPFLPFSPGLIPCSSEPLYPQALLIQTGDQSLPYLFPNPFRGGEKRKEEEGTCSLLGHWKGPAPMGFTVSYGLSPGHIC